MKIWRPDDLLYELAIEEPGDLDIHAIARACGIIEIREENLDGCEANILGWGDEAIIAVNKRSRPERQRFSIGHELGHWMHDRGTQAVRCDQRAFFEQWFTGAVNTEERANRYATDLLLPRTMFAPLAQNKPITFTTVLELAKIFQMSQTATAIRLVELGSYPAIVYCTKGSRRKWFARSPDFLDNIWPRDWPGTGSLAHQIISGAERVNPRRVPVSEWIEHENAAHCRVFEDSVRVTRDLVLTLLWWEDVDQLVELLGGDEDDLFS